MRGRDVSTIPTRSLARLLFGSAERFQRIHFAAKLGSTSKLAEGKREGKVFQSFVKFSDQRQVQLFGLSEMCTKYQILYDFMLYGNTFKKKGYLRAVALPRETEERRRVCYHYEASGHVFAVLALSAGGVRGESTPLHNFISKSK